MHMYTHTHSCTYTNTTVNLKFYNSQDNFLKFQDSFEVWLKWIKHLASTDDNGKPWKKNKDLSVQALK